MEVSLVERILFFQTQSPLDECTFSTLTFEDIVIGSNCAGDIIERTWTATDACGNSSTDSQLMTPVDNENPIIGSVGSNGTYSCGEAPVFTIPSAQDACSNANLSFQDSVTGSNCAGDIITRIWTATDECGNTSTTEQTMIPEDLDPPIISGVDPDGAYSCGESHVFSSPTASDNCNSAIINFTDAIVGSNCAGDIITRLWTATDECGNTSTAEQTLMPEDLVPPIITGVGPTGSFLCGENPMFSNPSAFDNCGSVELTFVDEGQGLDCAGAGIKRIWTATDECGNTSTAEQLMTTDDTIAPVISGVGTNGTYECGETPVFSSPTASDDCSFASISFVDEITGSTCAGDIITRTWTATDVCGNTSSAAQVMSAVDNSIPVLTGIAQDGMFNCLDTPVFSIPTAIDNCSNVSIVFTDEVSGANCAGDIITRTWTATDACGNTSTASQTMSPTDNENPVILGVGPNLILECGTNIVFSNPTADDACGTASISFEDNVTGNNCVADIVTRTWTATDACGNTSSASQTISFEDTTAPIISGVGPNGSFLCGEDPAFSNPSATDDCSLVNITFTDITDGNDCAGAGITRIWIATDECGNTSSASQTMTSDDNVPPIISGVGDDGNYICGQDPSFSSPEATDNCGSVNLSFEDFPAGSGCLGIGLERIWTATDACGNTTTASQIMLASDLEAPIITGVGPDRDFRCGDIPVFSSPEATDNCGTVNLSFEDVDFGNGCLDSGVIRTWTATDACGNSSTASQTMTYIDNVSPVITGVGPDGTYVCGEPLQFSDPTASDNCSTPTLEYRDVIIQGGCAGEGLRRRWTATDECGNTRVISQDMIPVDNQAPVITGVGPDGIYGCDGNPDWSTPIAIDECTETTLSFTDEQSGDVTTRTWMATDECGNISTAQQSFTFDSNDPSCKIDLELDKSVDEMNPLHNDEITFMISLNNASERDATDIMVMDMLPSGFEYVSHAMSAGTYNPETGMWIIAVLGGNEVVTLEITVRVMDGGDYLNLAEVISVNEEDSDSEPGNGVDTDGDGNVSDDSGDEDDGDGVLIDPIALSCIGDYVWKDLDGDGIQDDSEEGIEGIIISLVDESSGEVLTQTQTDASGYYQFCDLYPGDYHLVFTTPFDCIPTFQNSGDGSNDSDPDETGKTGTITLQGGETVDNIDAGFLVPAKVGNQVWVDSGPDVNVLDNGDFGLLGVVVTIYDSSTDEIIDQVTSDDFGRYLFCVKPGEYYIGFEPPSEHSFVIPNDGPDNIDSDADPNTGFTQNFTVGVGDYNLTFDAGFVPLDLAKIGNQVWIEDFSAQDNQYDFTDPDDRPLPGVTVNIYDAQTNTLIETDVTDENGNYLFCVPAGDYYLEFDSPVGIHLDANAVPGDDETDSDPDPVTGLTEIFSVEAGEVYYNWDAGFVDNLRAVIGNQVWEEAVSSLNGVYDVGVDKPIEGVKVTLFSFNGVSGLPVESTFTDENGQYSFNVDAGDYYLWFELPQGSSLSPVGTSANIGIDNDSDIFVSGFTSPFSVAEGATDLTWDAGYFDDLIVPVEYSNFEVSQDCDLDGVIVSWSTATESNSDYFIIERASEENLDFVQIALKDAAGFSQYDQKYEILDRDNLYEGVFYYRIKQVDEDGGVNYSNIVAIQIEKCDIDNVIDVSVYPNPTIDLININVLAYEEAPIEITLYARDGKLIRTLQIPELSKIGLNSFTYDVSDIPDGTYLIRITISGQTIIQKLNILK